MSAEYREMWADLYHFFERCATDPRWDVRNKEANDLVKKWNNNVFVIDVVAQTVSYWMNKGGYNVQI